MSRLKSVDRVCIAFAGEVRDASDAIVDALLLADIVLDDAVVILDITILRGTLARRRYVR